MASKDEVLQELETLKTTSQAQTVKLGEVATQLGKVQSETQGLKQKIADLEAAVNGGSIDEIAAKLAEVKTAFNAQGDAIAAVATAAQVADDEVEG